MQGRKDAQRPLELRCLLIEISDETIHCVTESSLSFLKTQCVLAPWHPCVKDYRPKSNSVTLVVNLVWAG